MMSFRKNKFGIYQEPRQELPSWLSKVETLSSWLSEVETLSCWLSEVETLSFDYAQEPANRINTYKFPHHAYKQRN